MTSCLPSITRWPWIAYAANDCSPQLRHSVQAANIDLWHLTLAAIGYLSKDVLSPDGLHPKSTYLTYRELVTPHKTPGVRGMSACLIPHPRLSVTTKASITVGQAPSIPITSPDKHPFRVRNEKSASSSTHGKPPLNLASGNDQ